MNPLTFILFMLFMSMINLWSHAGHAHGPTPGEEEESSSSLTGVELSPSAIQNLGIQTEEALLGPLQKQLVLPARIEVLPEKNAQITARFEGTVIEPLVKLGEAVKKDQPLIKLDPVLIGNPPVIYRSPLDGYVTQSNLYKGSSFVVGDLLMQVSNYEQVLVRGTSYERAELQEIKVGDPVQMTQDIFPHEIFSGTIQRFDVGVERENRTSEIFALIDNPQLRLRPYQQATLFLGVGERTDILSIPQRAILGETGNLFVFVQEGNRFERRSVLLGIQAGDRTEILEGILPGEKVVIQGNYQLQYAKPSPLHSEKKLSEEKEKSHDHSHSWWFKILAGLGSVAVVLFLIFIGRFYRSRAQSH